MFRSRLFSAFRRRRRAHHHHVELLRKLTRLRRLSPHGAVAVEHLVDDMLQDEELRAAGALVGGAR